MRKRNFFSRLTALFAAAVMICAAPSVSAAAASAKPANETKSVFTGPGDPDPVPSVMPKVESAPKLKERHTIDRVNVYWDKVKNAEKYLVYKLQPDGSYKAILVTKKTAFTTKNLEENTSITYKVAAVKGTKGKASTITVKTSSMQIFNVVRDSSIYTDVNTNSGVSIRSGYYTGYIDTISYKGFCVIYVRGGRCLIKMSDVQAVSGVNSKVLSCASISQLDGQIYHGYACGPGATAILFSAVSGNLLSVEQAIQDAQTYSVDVYSDYTFLNNGMPVRGIRQLLEAELRKNKMTGKSVYMTDISSYSAKKISSTLKSNIDKGRRVLVCLTESDELGDDGRMEFNYTNGGVTHYAVVTGYDTASDGTVYFYLGDSWYYEGDAYEYARDHNNYNRTTARYLYGLGKCSYDMLGKSIKAAANESTDLAGMIYIE